MPESAPIPATMRTAKNGIYIMRERVKIMLLTIPAYPIIPRPKCLLLGNGINNLFDVASWKKIIENELKHSKSEYSFSDIKAMPATMQIIVATNDDVSNRMHALAEEMLKTNMTEDRVQFLNKLLNLPMDDIFTTNYSFELEAADGMPMSKNAYSHELKKTKKISNPKSAFRIYQYYQTRNGKRIWHIHGDIAKPDTMLMGHYYYAKHLHSIQKCVPDTIKKESIAIKNDKMFRPDNWVDLFLTGDVYILGFGMYLCEADMWYLACCKKRHFPDTKITFYEMCTNDREKGYMMEAYNIHVVTGNDLHTNDYCSFYLAAIQDIQHRMENSCEV